MPGSSLPPAPPKNDYLATSLRARSQPKIEKKENTDIKLEILET